jgi:uncharacterized protein (DUF2267 family)
VLHGLRDRLPASDSVEFAQGLPMALKGVYFDQYDISRVPVVIRRADQFLDFIFHKGGRTALADFPNRRAVADALSAVFIVLERHMSYGQVRQIKNILNKEIQDIIDNY